MRCVHNLIQDVKQHFQQHGPKYRPAQNRKDEHCSDRSNYKHYVYGFSHFMISFKLNNLK